MTDKWPHHWTMKPNLEYIKINGLEKWLEAQKKEWTCPSCGAEIKWYQKVCSCGQNLEGWDLPLDFRPE
jgi:anaerobic ribonucleoside-triphosphate reductase